MSRRQVSRPSRYRTPQVATALGLVAVLILGGWSITHWGAPTSTSASPSASPFVAVATGTPVANQPAIQSPSPTPVSSATQPPSYPNVISCNPAAVPGSTGVSASASWKSGSFILHVPVLMYHRIVPMSEAGNSDPGLVVPPDTFSAHLDAIEAAGWHTITMATLANDLQAHIAPPTKSFVITIDDGWADGYTYALPILESHRFVATYYVIAGRIDKPDNLTSGQLQELVAAGDEVGDHTMDHVDLVNLPAVTLRYEIEAAAARIAQVTGFWPESFSYPSGGVDDAVVAAVTACGQLRSAVIEEPVAAAQPTKAKKTAVGVPVALETWSNRWVIPRVRITPNTKANYLADDLKILAEGRPMG
jgi:peptidoglycan/xylan/chitin deacetylase (PgdA/CDA1 family)